MLTASLRRRYASYFQTIKLNANFPNTVYLVAADRSVVEKSLDTEQGVSGRAYLEKIVQVGFDVPLPDAALVSAALRDEIDRIIASVPGADWEGYRWTGLYQAGFRGLFTNLRDVKRFFGALSFTLPMMQQDVIQLILSD